MLICNVVGTRPNFVKMAPIAEEFRNRDVPQMLVHTGQHYDKNMSKVFFEQLQLPNPDVYLGISGGSHGKQTGEIMIEFEKLCLEHKPDMVLVCGDVNSTVACALVAAKLHIPVAHVESGLRSNDRNMPEEINRVVTDHISDLLFTTEESGNQNLRNEGIDDEKIHFVGNCMVDSLLAHLDKALATKSWEALSMQPQGYVLATLHRPSNVDDPDSLRHMMSILNEVAQVDPIIFPVHPRTRKNLADLDIDVHENIHLSEPMPYLEFLGAMAKARFVMTDSGGIQEETTTLEVPCLTLRENTERPVTIDEGTNELVGSDRDEIMKYVMQIRDGSYKSGDRPKFWDGKANERIVDTVISYLAKRIKQ